MRPWLRLVLAWLLAAALPMQGWAAATMLNCGPSHERMASHHHVAQGAQVADGHHLHAHAQADQDDLHKLANFNCSACAVCCVSAALPATGFHFEAATSARFAVPMLPPTAAVFLTSGVERPPRS